MKKQGGFTIIELVLVIVILGILAAYAVPKFIGMDREARVAVMKGVRGSLESAMTMVHGRALIEGKQAASGDVIIDDNVKIGLVYGYPAAAASGDGQAAVGGITAALSQFDTNDFTVTSGTGDVTIKLNSAADKDQCYVKYTQPAAAGKSSTIAIDTTGC